MGTRKFVMVNAPKHSLKLWTCQEVEQLDLEHEVAMLATHAGGYATP